MEVEDTRTGETFTVRRVILKLSQGTTDGGREIRLLANLPKSITAVQVADLYRDRWTIERRF